MSEHVLKLIEELRAEVSEAEESIKPKKQLVNQLCERAGLPPVFTGIDDQQGGSSPTGIRRNAFYGRPLSTCIREYLEMRTKLAVREATLDEIFAALKEGGYDLKTSGDKEDDQKRGVAIAIGKNSQTFHRLPTGDFGLVAWYPNIKERKPKNGDSGKEEQPEAPLPAPTKTSGEFTMEGGPKI
jgi:hypothetical protein